MADNYGFVSQLQALGFHLDTSVRLCGESIAAAHKVFIESQDVRVVDYARVCMLDCYSQVMHNYYYYYLGRFIRKSAKTNKETKLTKI